MPRHYIDSLLGEREKILHTARQHWFILVSMVALETFFILLFFTATMLSGIFLQAYLPWYLSLVIGFVLIMLPIISMVRDFLIWTNHQFIVTNRRVMQISGIVNKNVIDSSLEKVNDVKMTQSFFGRIFNYGDIEILTASELGANLFRRIGKPVLFKTTMLNAKEKMELLPPAENRADNVPSLITGLDQLRQQGILTDEEFQTKKKDLLSKI
jgi:uncharacterized membrane protein YdbT with pleckstrin-like domain